MVTKLDKPIRREITINGEPYVLTIAPDGMRLTRKRFRTGVALSWRAVLARFGNSGTPSAESNPEH
jgi:hypothetical protein